MAEFEVPNCWVIIRFEVGVEDDLDVTLQDHTGRRLDVSIPFQPLPGFVPDISSFLAAAAEPLPPRRHDPQYDVDVPLAVFVDPPRGMEGEWWEGRILSSSPPNKAISIVRLARRRQENLSAFELPLDVLGAGSLGRHAMRALRNDEWYLTDPVVAQHGIRVRAVEREEIQTALTDVQDFVVTDADSVRDVLAHTQVANSDTPRLIVVADQFRDAPSALRFLPRFLDDLAAGTALLWLTGDYAEALRVLMRCLIHNYPLHEAAATIRFVTNAQALLVADPVSNVGLSMLDAYIAVAREVESLETAPNAGIMAEFLQRVSPQLTDDRIAMLNDAMGSAGPVVDTIQAFHGTPLSFERESQGIVPLSGIRAQLTNVRGQRTAMEEALTSVARDPIAADVIRRNQRRRVDIELKRVTYSEAASPRPDALSVPLGMALARATPYLLRLRVGRPFPGSHLRSEPPPLDPLLPEPEPGGGFHLEVVVFGLDFYVLGESVLPLYLPDLGGTSPLEIQVRAPDRLGAAQLRVGIYHRNHLLQMFRLDARIAACEEVTDDAGLGFQLEFSRTNGFSNLDKLGERAFSAALNDDPGGRTHMLMLKGHEGAAECRIPDELLGEQASRIRAILKEASETPNGRPRFPTNGAAQPSEDFYECMYKLAGAGRDLRRVLWRQPLIKPLLAPIREVSNKVIQFWRVSPTYAYPWTAIYDYVVPQRNSGDPVPRICLGRDCGCDRRTYCVKGFWGVRHRVEDLIKPPGEEDAALAVEGFGKPIALATDIPMPELSQALGGPDDLPAGKLVDVLWQAANRPAVLIIVGHLEEAEVVGEPVEPRIRIHPHASRGFLWPNLISTRAEDVAVWNQPRSLTLVLACGAGVTQITTLNNFVLAFNDAGAAGIVGTECLIFEDLAHRFATDVTAELKKGKALGESLTTFRRRLLEEGNPLGFVFTAIGDANLRIDL